MDIIIFYFEVFFCYLLNDYNLTISDYDKSTFIIISKYKNNFLLLFVTFVSNSAF